jgi:hypothetical protein
MARPILQLSSRGALHSIRFAAHVLKERKKLKRALRNVPRPITWDFAQPRLLPFPCGPFVDDPEMPVVRTTAPPGCAVEFGIDVGGVFPAVDALVAERWECSTEQLLEVSLANLRRRAARLPATAVTTATFSGRIVRMMRRVPYAASLLLAQDQLTRLFGAHDQVFAAPSRSVVLSFGIDTPSSVVAYTAVDFEMNEPLPLMLDPFLLQDGQLLWQPPDEEDED